MYETLSHQEVCSRLQGDLREGLTREEAARRCRENGKNELKERRGRLYRPLRPAAEKTHPHLGRGPGKHPGANLPERL